MSAGLDVFHPLIARWFAGRFGGPTEIQQRAWPHIAAGEHVFATAPTGSGKTLTAFLYAIHSLVVEKSEAGQGAGSEERTVGSRVLYVSPLKALNNDIQVNLERPLQELRDFFAASGVAFPEIRVSVRSGDTPAAERRRMLRRPPEILITTPESLNVLLTTAAGREMLSGLRTVILDEIHNTADNKRGTYLMTAIERLTRESGEFQRIALSATVRPIEETARFVAGYRLLQAGGEATYEPRKIRILSAPNTKRYDVSVCFPTAGGEPGDADAWWRAIIADFRGIISRNRSTLFFVNSRRMAEKITRLLNEDLDSDIAYAHHGSLSREVRLAVEQRLKSGALAAIVATGTLELGIDIGEVDEVVLVETPGEASSATQRIGRAGHGVGQVSRGSFYPLHARDFLDAAISAECVRSRAIEAVRIPQSPLDVLSQVLLSMCLEVSLFPDELYDFIRTCTPFHELERRRFDLVVDMLTGRYADRRIRELRPRLVHDGERLRSVEGVRALIYRSGGVIPDRGYFTLRATPTRDRVGELDEEFVWERSIGDVFPMGNRLWRIERITHNDVEATAVSRGTVTVPFWRADEVNRGFFFSERVGLYIEQLEARLDEPDLPAELAQSGELSPGAAEAIVTLLRQQRDQSGMPLPHRHRVTVEVYVGQKGQPETQVAIHTFWGGRLNRPLGLILSAALEEQMGRRVRAFHTNDSVLLIVPEEFSLVEVLRDIPPEKVLPLLRRSVESTAFFGALFRHAAQRSLLIPRRSFGERMPLWMSRVRSKRLFEAVATSGDFPILLEAWQDCLGSAFELPALAGLLEELSDGRINVEQRRVESPTPLARELVWRETNVLMYANDAPGGRIRSALDDDLVRLAASDGQGHSFADDTVAALRARLERTATGYAPGEWRDALLHIEERAWVGADEWDRLIAAIEREHGAPALQELLAELEERVCWLSTIREERTLSQGPGADGSWGVTGRHDAVRVGTILHAFTTTGEDPPGDRVLGFLAQWAVAPVCVSPTVLRKVFGIDEERARLLLLSAAERGLLQSARFGADEEFGWLLPENMERLLRARRTAARTRDSVLPLSDLPLFLGRLHGMTREEDATAASPEESMESLRAALERLFAFVAPADVWESDLLSDRVVGYRPALLDGLLRESDLIWTGAGRRRLRFLLEDDLELLEARGAELPELLQPLMRGGRFLVSDLSQSGPTAGQVYEALWNGLWAGQLTCESFESVRRSLWGSARASESSRPRAADRWKRSRPSGEYWRSLTAARDSLGQNSAGHDAVARLEQDRDRARVLLGRYGIVFRELLHAESPAFRGSQIFRALRLMELSGEVVGGHFWEGVSGWQFASQRALRVLGEWREPGDALWWHNAVDPVACTGPRYAPFQSRLPARLPTSRLLYRGASPFLTARRQGRELELWESPEACDSSELEPFWSHMQGALPKRAPVIVEKVNAVPVIGSPYEALLLSCGFRRDQNRLVRWKHTALEQEAARASAPPRGWS